MICTHLGVLAAQNTTPVSGGKGGQQLSISVRGLTADEPGVAILMEISSGNARVRVGNNTQMLGMVNGRFNCFNSGINEMGGVNAIKKVTFMGRDQDNIGEAISQRDSLGKRLKSPAVTMMRLL